MYCFMEADIRRDLRSQNRGMHYVDLCEGDQGRRQSWPGLLRLLRGRWLL
jgi:hypothetical protein